MTSSTLTRSASAPALARTGPRVYLRKPRKYQREPQEPAFSSTSVRLAGNGVTLRQLLVFREKFDVGSKLTKDVVRDIIIPNTCVPMIQESFCFMQSEFAAG